MSRVLAIDTSTSRTSVAVIQSDSVLFSGYKDGATAHGPSLPALVQEALAISDVDEGVVGMGPGRKEVYWARYTDGVRVGEPAVNFPSDVSGAPIHADLFPDMQSLVKLPGNITEPIYLRRPDAVAMVDR